MRRRIATLAKTFTAAAKRVLRAFWWYLRQVSGDAAYENYCRRVQSGAGTVRRSESAAAGCKKQDDVPVSQEEHYLQTLRRRYSGVSRCC